MIEHAKATLRLGQIMMGYLVLLVVSAPVIIPQFMGFLDVFDISEIFHKPEVSWRPWPAPEDLHNFHRTAELNLEIQEMLWIPSLCLPRIHKNWCKLVAWRSWIHYQRRNVAEMSPRMCMDVNSSMQTHKLPSNSPSALNGTSWNICSWSSSALHFNSICLMFGLGKLHRSTITRYRSVYRACAIGVLEWHLDHGTSVANENLHKKELSQICSCKSHRQ